MKTIYHKFTYTSEQETFRVWPLFDWHVGARAFDEKLFRQHVQTIAEDDKAYWIGGGDYQDSINQKDHKRFKPETVHPRFLTHSDIFKAEIDYSLELIKPIAGKCLGLVEGNHEYAVRNHLGYDVYSHFVGRIADHAGKDAAALAVGVGGFISLNFRRTTPNSSGNGWNVDIFAHHGFGGGRKAGGHALTLQDVMSNYDADLYLMGHRHIYLSLSKVTAAPHHRGSRTRTRYGVFMPSYLRSFIETQPDESPVDTYPELIALPPSPVGAFPIEINPSQRKISLLVAYERE